MIGTNNYVVMKKKNIEVAVWTKVELTDPQKKDLENYIKQNDRSIKKQQFIYFYGYDTFAISDWGNFTFAFENENVTVTTDGDELSHINFGIFDQITIGDLVLKIEDADGIEGKTYKFSIEIIEGTIPDGKYGDVEFINNKANITLEGIDTAYILNLPPDIVYQITDESDVKYTDKVNDSSKIPSNGMVLAVFKYGSAEENTPPVDEKPPVEEKNPDSEKNTNTSIGLKIVVTLGLLVSSMVLVVTKKKMI